MTTHDLKIWPEPFVAILTGDKPYEYRHDDRGFAVDDVLHLREWDPDTGAYTGSWANADVTHITRGPEFGVPVGFVVMGIALTGAQVTE